MSFEPRLPDDRVNVSGTNPLAEAGLLVAGLVAVVVAIAVTSSLVMEWLVPRLPTSLEVRVFGGGWLPSLGPDDTEEQAPDGRQASLQALVDRLPEALAEVLRACRDPRARLAPESDGSSAAESASARDTVGDRSEPRKLPVEALG